MVFAFRPRPYQYDLVAVGAVRFVKRAWVGIGVGLKGCSGGRSESLSVVRPPSDPAASA